MEMDRQLPDQYADDKVARSWRTMAERKDEYYEFLLGLLKEKGCKKILDASCGTG